MESQLNSSFHSSTPLDVITLLQIRDIDTKILNKHSAAVLNRKIENNLACVQYFF